MATVGRRTVEVTVARWVVDLNAGTLAAFYYKNVRQYDLSTRDAVVAPQQDLKLTVQQLDRHVYAYGKGFLEGLGVRKGTTVVVWMGSDVENFVIQSACALLGATTVSVDPAADWDVLLKTVASTQARALFLSPRYGAESRVDKLHTVLEAEFEPFARAAVWGYAPLVSKRMRALKYVIQSGHEAVDGVVRLRDLPVHGNEGEYDQDDIAAAQFDVTASDGIMVRVNANGTTLATSTHAQALGTAAAAAKALALTSADTVALTAPAHSQFGFVAGWLAALGTHAKLVLPQSKGFDAAKTLAAMTQQRATTLVATVDQVRQLGAALAQDAALPESKRQYSLAALRAGLVTTQGAAPGGDPVALGSAKLHMVDDAKQLA